MYVTIDDGDEFTVLKSYTCEGDLCVFNHENTVVFVHQDDAKRFAIATLTSLGFDTSLITDVKDKSKIDYSSDSFIKEMGLLLSRYGCLFDRLIDSESNRVNKVSVNNIK